MVVTYRLSQFRERVILFIGSENTKRSFFEAIKKGAYDLCKYILDLDLIKDMPYNHLTSYDGVIEAKEVFPLEYALLLVGEYGDVNIFEIVWSKILRNIGLTQQHFSEFQLEIDRKLLRMYQSYINTAYALAVINKHDELLPCFNGFVTDKGLERSWGLGLQTGAFNESVETFLESIK